MASAPFNAMDFNQWPATQLALRRTYDTRFLAGLTSFVALEFDTGSAGTVVGQHGEIKVGWELVPGFDAIPCRFVWLDSKTTEGSRPGQVRTGVVLFGAAIPADRRYRLAIQEPDRDELTYLYLQGPVRDEGGTGHHWVVEIQDLPL